MPVLEQDIITTVALIDRRIAQLETELITRVEDSIARGEPVRLREGRLAELQAERDQLRTQRRSVVRMGPGTSRTGSVIQPQAFDTGTALPRGLQAPERQAGMVLKTIRDAAIIQGPIKWMQQLSTGAPPPVAQSAAVTALSGTASSMIFDGGRKTMTNLMTRNKEVEGYIRVTSDDPCAFCAMLSSRGPVYKSRETAKGMRFSAEDADFKVHDHCACYPQPMFVGQTSRDEWPGRASEFRALWDHTMHTHSYTDFPDLDAAAAARRAFGRSYREYSSLVRPRAFQPYVPRFDNLATRAASQYARRFTSIVGRRAYQATGFNLLTGTNGLALRDFPKSFADNVAHQLSREAVVLRTIGKMPINNASRVIGNAFVQDLISESSTNVSRLIGRETGKFLARNPHLARLTRDTADRIGSSLIGTRVASIRVNSILANPAVRKRLNELVSSVSGYISREFARTGIIKTPALLSNRQVSAALSAFTKSFTSQFSKQFNTNFNRVLQEHFSGLAARYAAHRPEIRRLLQSNSGVTLTPGVNSVVFGEFRNLVSFNIKGQVYSIELTRREWRRAQRNPTYLNSLRSELLIYHNRLFDFAPAGTASLPYEVMFTEKWLGRNTLAVTGADGYLLIPRNGLSISRHHTQLPNIGIARHEFGHVIDYRGNLNLNRIFDLQLDFTEANLMSHSFSKRWTQIRNSDEISSRAWFERTTGQTIPADSIATLRGVDPTGAGWPVHIGDKSVTGYGATHLAEDFAESIRLYWMDREGTRLSIGRYAEIWPARAAYFDEMWSRGSLQ